MVNIFGANSVSFFCGVIKTILFLPTKEGGGILPIYPAGKAGNEGGGTAGMRGSWNKIGGMVVETFSLYWNSEQLRTTCYLKE
jgi:hypothetical protein